MSAECCHVHACCTPPHSHCAHLRCGAAVVLERSVNEIWVAVSVVVSVVTNDSYMTSNKTDKRTIGGSKITAKQQPTNHYNFHVLTTNHITTKMTKYPNQNQRHKYHHLTTTLHFTLMTTAQVVEMSVTNNSLSKDYPHPDDHAKQITDTPGFKPFTMSL